MPRTWKQEKKLLKKESKFIRLLTMFGVPGNFRSMNLPPNNWRENENPEESRSCKPGCRGEQRCQGRGRGERGGRQWLRWMRSATWAGSAGISNTWSPAHQGWIFLVVRLAWPPWKPLAGGCTGARTFLQVGSRWPWWGSSPGWKWAPQRSQIGWRGGWSRRRGQGRTSWRASRRWRGRRRKSLTPPGTHLASPAAQNAQLPRSENQTIMRVVQRKVQTMELRKTSVTTTQNIAWDFTARRHFGFTRLGRLGRLNKIFKASGGGTCWSGQVFRKTFQGKFSQPGLPAPQPPPPAAWASGLAVFVEFHSLNKGMDTSDLWLAFAWEDMKHFFCFLG